MQPNYPEISFDDTRTAFAHKSDKELKKARWLFSTMSHPWIVKLGITATPLALKAGLPVKGLIRSTIYEQFVGGESLETTAAVVDKLAASNVTAILDYGVEGKQGEENFNHAAEEFTRVAAYAVSQPNIPFMSVKVTGFARFDLLQLIDAIMRRSKGDLMGRFEIALATLDDKDREEWNRVEGRLQRICGTAATGGVGVFIDAEETWIQEPVDAIATKLMEQYNRESVYIYNTPQLYRHDRLEFLKLSHKYAREKGFLLGAKLVRGAYMEKERARAEAMGYPSPIQPDKAATDRDFNEAVKYCIEHIDSIGLIVASHNEYSNLYTTELMKKHGLPFNHPRVHFSQLMGMSDNITFNLARAGCAVSKFLPYGPISDVIPYLMRRARENTSVRGQTSRELKLIDDEIKRRRGE